LLQRGKQWTVYFDVVERGGRGLSCL
jgi:hypothetical protein